MKRVVKKIENEPVIEVGKINGRDNVFVYDNTGNLIGMIVRKPLEEVWALFSGGAWICENPNKLGVIDDLMQPHRGFTLYVA